MSIYESDKGAKLSRVNRFAEVEEMLSRQNDELMRIKAQSAQVERLADALATISTSKTGANVPSNPKAEKAKQA